MTAEQTASLEANVDLIWSLWRCDVGAVTKPSELNESTRVWRGSSEQLTVGSLIDCMEPDQSDWWLTTELQSQVSVIMTFASVYGWAIVWLNDAKAAVFDNAFRPWQIPVAGLESQQQIALHFPSLTTPVIQSHGRARWRTNLVTNQHLRSHRVSLAGRIPGWFSRTPLVGIRGPVTVTPIEENVVTTMIVLVDNERSRLQIGVKTSAPVKELTVGIGGQHHVAPLSQDDMGQWTANVLLDCFKLERWWPHTHGEPVLHDVEITLGLNTTVRRRVGFKSVVFDQNTGQFLINGIPVFCRGACWIALQAAEVETEFNLEARLHQVRDAGFNMLRVVGTSCYESDLFYDLCDRLGILVWQDLPFANMAYPESEHFANGVFRELEWQSSRLAWHACLAVICGNSDGEQQATLLGLHESKRTQQFFTTTIRAWSADLFPNQKYIPSAPGFGPLPTHLSAGVSSFFGVGAYRRSVDDRSVEQVRFASECLGFANVPDLASMSDLFGSSLPSPTSAIWKSGSPRDNGVGWDFDDVRDHYTGQLFSVNTLELRMSDLPRYFELSRLSSGIAMTTVLSRWRATRSQCQGALIWMMHDIKPGAGWGLVDVLGRPKPAYHMVRSVLQPVQVLVTDENFDGHDVHLINEQDVEQIGVLTVTLVLMDGRAGGKVVLNVVLPPRSVQGLSVDACFDRFQDTTWSYRFGMPAFRAVAADLLLSNGTSIQHVATVGCTGIDIPGDIQFAACLVHHAGTVRLLLESDRLLEWAHIESSGFECIDNYVHVIPGISRQIAIRVDPDYAGVPSLRVRPANSRRELRISELGKR
jgi:beta-mannosidase